PGLARRRSSCRLPRRKYGAPSALDKPPIPGPAERPPDQLPRPFPRKQRANRAAQFWLRPSLLGSALGLEPCPQAKARRLRRMAALAMLPAAHPSAALLHRPNLVRTTAPVEQLLRRGWRRGDIVIVVSKL